MRRFWWLFHKDRLLGYLLDHKDALTESICQRTYRPNPVRRVEIPKEGGKKRLLGIPTVVDRMIQQAIAQVLTPIYERQFSEGSFGFRPRRGAKQALVRVTEIVGDGVFISVSKNIYYENRFFCKVILDSKNNRMIQLGFDKDNTERFHFEDKNQWYVTKSMKILQKFGFY